MPIPESSVTSPESPERIGPFLSFEIPFTPAASKNARFLTQIRDKRTGFQRNVSLPNKTAQLHSRAIRALVRQELIERGCDLIPLRGRRVGFEMDWHAFEDKVCVRILDLGPIKAVAIPGNRRDLQNMDAVILDAMNGLLFDDDSQIRYVKLTTFDDAPNVLPL